MNKLALIFLLSLVLLTVMSTNVLIPKSHSRMDSSRKVGSTSQLVIEEIKDEAEKEAVRTITKAKSR